VPTPPTPAPAQITPPTLPHMSATRTLALRARGPAPTTWIALAVVLALAALAGAYYAFAPRPVFVAAPSEPASAAAEPVREPARASPQPPSPLGEAEEMALKLTTADRQRIQAALTSLGFDTRGTDGAFGPRSREMIAAWQRARKRPATGYLTAADNQALREAQTTRSTASPRPGEESTAPAEPLLVDPPPAPPPAPPSLERVFLGSLSGSATGGQVALAPMEADLRLVDLRLTGRLVHPVCGTLPVSLAIDASGSVSGSLRLYEAGGCATNTASAGGRISGGTLTLDLRGIDVSFRGTLSSRAAPSPATPAPSSGQRTAVP
jgi:hypothetical protein